MQYAGALYSDGRCRFTVWAPEKETMILHLVSPDDRKVEMLKNASGYFTVDLYDIEPGSRYFYMPDGVKDYPDPTSFYQPEGVSGPSEVLDHNGYQWQDKQWRGLPLKELIFYELHVGTFSPEGTFEAVIGRLDDIVQTGINAIELMPVGQFPGNRNWGYDGTFLYAVQNSYGGPNGLKKLIDACHSRGIAVFLDVVYNHTGPEGNYLDKFMPHLTDKYATPWGKSINFDGPWSDGVRDYFCNNALYWYHHFHLDGLRLDAIHEIYDFGATHFFELLHDKVKAEEQKEGRRFYLIAESDLNNPKVVKHPVVGGYGFDAQWLDDFHHALYVLLDEKGLERYEDFGRIEQLAKAYTDGFVHSGEPVKFRRKKHGASSAGIQGDKFIVFNQNHDQVGNRVDGERLSVLVNFDLLKIAAAAVLLSPYIPMLFMGEEYGEDAPFHYFISHYDEKIIAAVRNGRKREFQKFNWEKDPPDPQSEETFNDSKLRWHKRNDGAHRVLLEWNKALITLRKTHAGLRNISKDDVRVYLVNAGCFVLHRRSQDLQEHALAFFNLTTSHATYLPPFFSDKWFLVLDSGKFSVTSGAEAEQIHVLPQEIFLEQEIIIPAQTVAVYLNEL